MNVFVRSLAEAAGMPVGRPRIIAVDGRGGGGKTALAERLGRELRPAAVVHSDDVAWAHSRFGRDDPMTVGILEPLHAGMPVHYRPPGWDRDGRKVHIDVATDASTVIIEGVGVSRRELARLIDVAVWVQSDFGEAKRRGLRRDMAELNRDEDGASRFRDEWEAEEVPFLLDDCGSTRLGLAIAADIAGPVGFDVADRQRVGAADSAGAVVAGDEQLGVGDGDVTVLPA